MKWRKNIDKTLQPFVESLISESYKETSKLDDGLTKHQLWVALGILSRQLYNTELKLKYLEGALKEISPRGKLEKSEKFAEAETEVEKLISEIASGKIIKPETNKEKNRKTSKKDPKSTKKSTKMLTDSLKKNF